LDFQLVLDGLDDDKNLFNDGDSDSDRSADFAQEPGQLMIESKDKPLLPQLVLDFEEELEKRKPFAAIIEPSSESTEQAV
jgi:Fe-S cluster assembly iron-binding protein IscA